MLIMYAFNKIQSLPASILECTRKSIKSALSKEDKLTLAGYSFIDIDSNSFRLLTNLKHLNLAWNKCPNLSRSRLTDLNNLETLSIDCCSINSIEAHTFHELTNLKILDLSWNRIHALSRPQMTGLGNLVRLDLHECTMTRIEKDTFQEMKALKDLDLSFNQFDEFSRLNGLSRYTLNLYY